MPTGMEYPHRRNSDGTWDSICTNCFQTVAHCETESKLAQFEKAHVCDPSVLAELRYAQESNQKTIGSNLTDTCGPDDSMEG